jgi:DNA-directed RNA polymerase subunit RPC12/RpoP
LVEAKKKEKVKFIRSLLMEPRIIRVSDFQDKNLICIDCGAPFVWNAGEQAFFASKRFETTPKRCPDCRKIRRLSLVLDDRPSKAGGDHGS